MKQEYIITNDELATEYGLDLNELVIDTSKTYVFIHNAYEMMITAIFHLNDNLEYEEDIEKILDKEPRLAHAFKKCQYQVIYNLCYKGDTDPIDIQVERIICGDLHLGSINGWQKNIYRR